MRPCSGRVRDDPLDVRLRIASDPLPRKVAPVAVAPLRYTDPIALTDPEALVTSIDVGVRNCPRADWTPPSHSVRK